MKFYKTHAFIGSDARYLLVGWTPWNRFKWGLQFIRREEPRVVFTLGFHKPARSTGTTRE